MAKPTKGHAILPSKLHLANEVDAQGFFFLKHSKSNSHKQVQITAKTGPPTNYNGLVLRLYTGVKSNLPILSKTISSPGQSTGAWMWVPGQFVLVM